jgi:hypothetical protein
MAEQSRTLAAPLAALAAVFLAAPTALAQVDDDSDADPDALDRRVQEVLEEGHPLPAPKVGYGVGPRLRYVFFPKGIIEVFVEEASSGVGSPGFGVEFVRRKGNFELQVGLEYDNLSPSDGFWLEKGDCTQQGAACGDGQQPDFLRFEGLGWVTLDTTFVFHHPLHEMVALRYGAGFGLGVVTGKAVSSDQQGCVRGNFENTCQVNPAGEVNKKESIPPVFPVVNMLAGVQFRPLEQLTINLEGGMRTLFFFGLSSTYFF